MREVIIGLIQLENELGDKEHNLEKAVSLIGEAAKKGAGIICLPELFVTGYHLEALKDDLYDMAERPDGAVFARLCGGAQAGNLYNRTCCHYKRRSRPDGKRSGTYQ